MWYAPGMGKGAAKPYIGTIYYPSVLTWSRMKQIGPEERVENNTAPTPALSVSGSTQSSPDHPAPVRCGVRTTRGQLPWRYRNFGLLTDARPTGIRDAKVDLRVCLHILIWLCNLFKRGECESHYADHRLCTLNTAH